MKIKISWAAFSNINFKGSDIIEIDDEDWESMDEEERSEFIDEQGMELSGVGFEYDNVE